MYLDLYVNIAVNVYSIQYSVFIYSLVKAIQLKKLNNCKQFIQIFNQTLL